MRGGGSARREAERGGPEEQLEESTRELLEELDEEVLKPKEKNETQWRAPMLDRLYTKPAVYSSSDERERMSRLREHLPAPLPRIALSTL
jgi:hypothetical protein